MYVKEALSGINSRLLDKAHLIRDTKTGNIRTTELTPLMVACMMGNIQTAKILIEHAREVYKNTPEDFRLFIDV